MRDAPAQQRAAFVASFFVHSLTWLCKDEAAEASLTWRAKQPCVLVQPDFILKIVK